MHKKLLGAIVLVMVVMTGISSASDTQAQTQSCVLTVSIAPSTPAAQNISPGQSGVNLVKFNAVSNCDGNLVSFAVSLLPMPNGYQNISAIRLYDDSNGTQLGTTQSVTTAGMNFPSVNKSLIANQTLVLRVMADVSPSAVIGSTVYGIFGGSWGVTGSGGAIGNNTSGNIMMGNTMTISANGSGTTTATPAPSTPTNLASDTIATPTNVTITWTNTASSAVFFNISRIAGNGTWTFLASTALTTLQSLGYADLTVSPNTNYTYHVQACYTGGANCSAYSDTITVVTPTNIPSTPTNLASNTIATPTNITITWTNTASSPVFFNISRITGNGTWTFITSTALTTIQSVGYADLSVSPDTYYTYHVQACYAGGANCSAYTDAIGVRTPGVAATSATLSLSSSPSGATATDINTGQTYCQSTPCSGVQVPVPPSSISIRFSKSGYGEANSYAALYAGTTINVSAVLLPLTSTGTTSSTTTATSGSGTNTNSTSNTTSDTTPPTTPTNLTGYASPLIYINLTWSASSDNIAVAGYKIFRNGMLISTGPSISGQTDYFYFDDNVLPNTEYIYYIVAYDTSGLLSTPSTQVSIKTPSESNTTTTPTTYNPQPTTTTSATSPTTTISYQTTPTSSPMIVQYGYLRGNISDSSGTAIPYATAYIWNDSGLHRSASADVNGNFYLSVPAGTFTVEILLPTSRNDLIKPSPSKISLSTGESRELKINIQKITTIEKIIKGQIVLNNAVSTPISDAQVSAYNELTKQWLSVNTDSNGNYSFRVNPGKWSIDVHPNDSSKSSWYRSAPPMVLDLTNPDSETRELTLAVSATASKLTVSLSDENGSPVSGAGISVSLQLQSASPVLAPQYNKSDADGSATFWLRKGSYAVNAFLPDSNYLNPETKIIESIGTDQKIQLIFKSNIKASSAVKGTVRLDDGTTVEGAYVSAWSKSNGFTDLKTDFDGNFYFQSLPGDVWHIGAGKQIDNSFYKAPETIVTAKSASTFLGLTLVKVSSAVVTTPTVVSTETTKPALAVTESGASVFVPEKSVNTTNDSPITISVVATANAPSRADARVVGNAYDVKIHDNNGNEIKEFNSDLEINLPYTDEMLKSLGTSDKAIKPSYFDESTGAWVKIDNFTIDKEKHVVIIRVRHLTRFALVAPADTTPPPAPTKLAFFAVAIGAPTLTWSNPAADFHHVKIYRSESSKSIGKVVNDLVTKNNFSDTKLKKKTYYYTLRSVDAAGNESKNAKVIKVNAAITTKMPIPTGLASGKRSVSVKILQKALVTAGFLSPDFPFNNLFDGQTLLAVKAFQKENKLTTNGKIDAKTASLLNKIYLLNQ